MKQSVGILDNKSLGNVVSELKENIAAGCTLSVVSALFSLYAYDELKKALSKVSKFKLLVLCYGNKEGFVENLPGNYLDCRLRMYCRKRLKITAVSMTERLRAVPCSDS